MPDPSQLEREAAQQNSQGHQESFAAQHFNVLADVEEAHNRYVEAARHYHRAGADFAGAAEEHLRAAAVLEAVAGSVRRSQAATDHGLAASDYWYAGRAYADAYDFEHAGDEMEASARAYVAGARLCEGDGRLGESSTLRVEATFRYLDAQRYYEQAAEFHRNLAGNFESIGERRAAADERRQSGEIEDRARAAAASVNEQGPELHAGYQDRYSGANRSEYK
jgi:hypothetical protein